MIAERQRPWTVYALVGISVVGTVWGLISAERFTPYDAISLAFGLWLTYAVWMGKVVAHRILFMLTTLCVVFMTFILIFQLFLYETGLDLRVVQALVMSLITAALLVHPLTKRFAGERVGG